MNHWTLRKPIAASKDYRDILDGEGEVVASIIRLKQAETIIECVNKCMDEDE